MWFLGMQIILSCFTYDIPKFHCFKTHLLFLANSLVGSFALLYTYHLKPYLYPNSFGAFVIVGFIYYFICYIHILMCTIIKWYICNGCKADTNGLPDMS